MSATGTTGGVRPPLMALRREAGFMLVEVLVAMVVVAIGILALAALLQASTRYSKLGQLRATATLLANDIADRIRANPTGGYDLADAAFPTPAPPPHAPCTSEAPCGPSELAGADLAEWWGRLRATLPAGSAQVKFHAASPPAPALVDVWVGWSDPLARSPGATGDRTGSECPDAWKSTDSPVRCVHLQVAP